MHIKNQKRHCLFCLNEMIIVIPKWNGLSLCERRGVMKRAACRRPRKRQWSTSTTIACFFLFFNLPFSSGRRRPDCTFPARRRSTLVDVGRRVEVRRRPFYSPFHHARAKQVWAFIEIMHKKFLLTLILSNLGCL